MKVRQLLLAAILSLGVSVARAEIVDVSDNHGGLLSAYQTQWALFAARQVDVRIVGPCVSACTVLIGYIPRQHICVAPGGYLGFHWATAGSATQELWSAYERSDAMAAGSQHLPLFPQVLSRLAAPFATANRAAKPRRKAMRVTRRFVTFAATLALAAPSLLQASRLSAQSNEEAAVLQAVDALTKAMLDADRGRLEEVVADQLSYGHSSGVIQTKAQFVDVIINKQTIYKSIVLSEPSTVIAGNYAIVRHMAAVDYEDGGKAGSAKIGVLQLWVKQDGRWKLLARQAFRS
jgi:hypothetical protein